MAITIQITPTRVIFSGGKFDSEFFYIRSSPTIGEYRMPRNFTLVARKRAGGGFYQAAQFSYSSVSYTHAHAGRFDSNTIAFSPETDWVKFT